MSDIRDISVVICAYTHDRWDDLVSAVASMHSQTLQPREVIVVIDHNPELFARAGSALDGVVVIENHERKGLSGARNSGIARAQGQIIAFMDEDAVAERRMPAPEEADQVGDGSGRLLVAKVVLDNPIDQLCGDPQRPVPDESASDQGLRHCDNAPQVRVPQQLVENERGNEQALAPAGRCLEHDTLLVLQRGEGSGLRAAKFGASRLGNDERFCLDPPARKECSRLHRIKPVSSESHRPKL